MKKILFNDCKIINPCNFNIQWIDITIHINHPYLLKTKSVFEFGELPILSYNDELYESICYIDIGSLIISILYNEDIKSL